MEDKILLERIANGDEGAFVLLLDKYESRVFHYFQRCFSDSYTAEDLAQNVFVIILRQLREGRELHYFNRYLFKVCKNVALKKATRRRKFFAVPIEVVSQQADYLQQQEADQQLKQALENLPLMQKQALLLKFMENFSIKEIAEILEIPENTVKSHLHRGKQQLRKSLGDYYENG